jgi:hypothetical protein
MSMHLYGEGRDWYLPVFLGILLVSGAWEEGIIAIEDNIRDPLRVLWY